MEKLSAAQKPTTERERDQMGKKHWNSNTQKWSFKLQTITTEYLKEKNEKKLLQNRNKPYQVFTTANPCENQEHPSIFNLKTTPYKETRKANYFPTPKTSQTFKRDDFGGL